MNRLWISVPCLLWMIMAVSFIGCQTLQADEGMWLFNQAPRAAWKSTYQFEPTDAWLEHLQKSAVRFNSGGSGSFVSSRGLVMTNHHVGADALQKMSTPDHDFFQTGFLAKTTAEEIPCADLELNVLMKITDVTQRVNDAVNESMSSAEAQLARRAIMNTIEKEGLDQTGMRSDVVTLYQGGLYHLYQFKKYTDVRLVFAPEKDIAFFGGDADNFEFPRYDLDICFFRAYENNQPVHVEHYLRWSPQGAAEGELIFVAGHPGRTDRLKTMSHLESLRDIAHPQRLDLLRRREVLLMSYSGRGPENARRAADDLFGFQNSRKAVTGGLAGLQDPAVMARKQQDEQTLRAKIAANESWRREFGSSWDEVADHVKIMNRIRTEYGLWETGTAFHSELFALARILVRMADEDAKPNAQRLPEFSEAGRESLELRLYSDAPIYDDLETIKLADSLSMMVEKLGPNHTLVQQVLHGVSPQVRASQLVRGTRLQQVAARKELAQGGKKAIAASDDTMIHVARLVDAAARGLRTEYEQQVEEPDRQAYGRIAKARLAVGGTDNYPDATFTLRIAYGVVKGYEDNGVAIPAWTTMGGAFTHAEAHRSAPPFALPPRWLERRQQIQADTPFNFVSTADIIGGNSGSPVVNRQGEVVGIIFDGNIHSLVLNFAYTDEVARAVSVDSRAIREALAKIYDAQGLEQELGN